MYPTLLCRIRFHLTLFLDFFHFHFSSHHSAGNGGRKSGLTIFLHTLMGRISRTRMNPCALLHNIVVNNPLSRETFMSKGNYRDASIACILRLTSPATSSDTFSSILSRFNTVDEVLLHMKDRDVSNEPATAIDMLFIKRAMRSGDQWGGHVAWPGGFLNANENAVSGVRREVLEEIGIDLESTHFAQLGAMRQTPFGPTNKTLNPVLFLKMTPEECCFELEEKEVDAVAWINVEHFLECTSSSHLETHTVSAEKVIKLSGWQKNAAMIIARVLGFDKWHFPCIRIRPKEVKAYTCKFNPKEDWVIWGLTFNTIRRLLKHANDNQEYIPLSAPYSTENWVFNAAVSIFYRLYSKRYDADLDPNLHRKILISSLGVVACVYCSFLTAGVGIYNISMT